MNEYSCQDQVNCVQKAEQTVVQDPNMKVGHVTMNGSSYELPGHPFARFSSPPTWFSGKEPSNNFPEQSSATEYVLPTPDKLNVNFKSPHFIQHQQTNQVRPPPQIAPWRPCNQNEIFEKGWFFLSFQMINHRNKLLLLVKKQTKRKIFCSSKTGTKKFKCTHEGCCKKFSKEKELKVHVNKHHLRKYFLKLASIFKRSRGFVSNLIYKSTTLN